MPVKAREIPNIGAISFSLQEKRKGKKMYQNKSSIKLPVQEGKDWVPTRSIPWLSLL